MYPTKPRNAPLQAVEHKSILAPQLWTWLCLAKLHKTYDAPHSKAVGVAHVPRVVHALPHHHCQPLFVLTHATRRGKVDIEEPCTTGDAPNLVDTCEHGSGVGAMQPGCWVCTTSPSTTNTAPGKLRSVGYRLAVQIEELGPASIQVAGKGPPGTLGHAAAVHRHGLPDVGWRDRAQGWYVGVFRLISTAAPRVPYLAQLAERRPDPPAQQQPGLQVVAEKGTQPAVGGLQEGHTWTPAWTPSL